MAGGCGHYAHSNHQAKSAPVALIATPLVAELPPGQKLIATTVTATFTAPLKLALVAGC